MRAWARVGLLAAVAAITAAGCARPKQEAKHPPPEAGEEKPAVPERVRLKGGEFVLASPDGKRLWQGKGASFEWDTEAQTATLKAATGTFFREGKAALKASAPSIRVDYRARVVYCERGAEAESLVTGASFRADRVEWRAREHKVYGQGNVKFVHGQSQAAAERLVGDTALRRVRLEGQPVTLRIAQGAGKALW